VKAHQARAQNVWPFLLGLALLVSVTFWNSQGGVFLFDDFASIHQNATIRELWPPWLAFNPPGRGESVAGRPLANWTLALNYAAGGLEVRGYHVVNIDSTLVLQSPKIAPHVLAMRQQIANTLNLGVEQVSVKATTNEGLGSLGAGEGCAAYAVATLEK